MATPNYRVTLSYDGDRKVYSAQAPELAHCSGEGATRSEAVARLEEEIAAQIANMQAHGSNPPAAVDEVVVTGEIGAKVSHGLHRELLWLARSEGVELGQLVGELLAASLESRKHGGGQKSRGGNQRHDAQPSDGFGNERNGNSRGPNRSYGPRYNPAMDDRANFIEYVRTLEGGQGQGPSGPAGGGGPGAGRRRRRGPGGGGPGGPGGGPGGGAGGGGRMQGGGGNPGNGGNGGNGPRRP